MQVKTLFTHDEIQTELKKGDFFLFDDAISSYGYIEYKLTDSEKQWMEFVRNRYSIFDYIQENTDEHGVTKFYTDELSKALDDDCGGFGKATCLSDESSLQAICFYLYCDDYDFSEIE